MGLPDATIGIVDGGGAGAPAGAGAGFVPPGGNPAEAGTFGSDTRVDLRNSAGTVIEVLRILTRLVVDTPGSEVAAIDLMPLAGAGLEVVSLTVTKDGIALPAGTVTNPSLLVGAQPLCEVGGVLRVGARFHSLDNDGWTLAPSGAATGKFVLDGGGNGGVFQRASGVALRGAGVDAAVALASGAQLWGFGTTAGAVTAGRVVALNSGGNIILADNTTPTNCLGITVAGQVGAGAIAYVVRGIAAGVLSGATPGTAYYLGASGAITTTRATNGRDVFLGTAESATDLRVAIVDQGPAVPLFMEVFAGHNGAGGCALSGVKVGDVVKFVQRPSDGSDARSLFEPTITVGNQIQQSSAVNLSGNTYLATVWRQS